MNVKEVKEFKSENWYFHFGLIVLVWWMFSNDNPAILFFSLLFSSRYVEHERDTDGNVINAELIIRGLESSKYILKPGIYFFFLINLWGKIYRVLPSQNKDFVYHDSRDVQLQSKRIGPFGIFFNNFVLPYIRANWWVIMVCFMSSFLIFMLIGKQNVQTSQVQTKNIKSYSQSQVANPSIPFLKVSKGVYYSCGDLGDGSALCQVKDLTVNKSNIKINCSNYCNRIVMRLDGYLDAEQIFFSLPQAYNYIDQKIKEGEATKQSIIYCEIFDVNIVHGKRIDRDPQYAPLGRYPEYEIQNQRMTLCDFNKALKAKTIVNSFEVDLIPLERYKPLLVGRLYVGVSSIPNPNF